MGYVTNGPTSEPVTLSEAKAWLRVTGNDEDGLIRDLISAAREHAEHDTGLALLQQTIVQYMDKVTDVYTLDVGPVTSVTSIQYRDTTNGTYQTWASSNYEVDLISEPQRIALLPTGTHPDIGDYLNPIKITYVAGQTDANKLPLARLLMRQLIAKWYENREDMPEDGAGAVYNRSASAIASKLRKSWV